jgi:hypothetical protein
VKPAEGYEDWPPPAAKRFRRQCVTADTASAMELAAAASPLTAHRLVLRRRGGGLGSDITRPTDNPTETTRPTALRRRSAADRRRDKPSALPGGNPERQMGARTASATSSWSRAGSAQRTGRAARRIMTETGSEDASPFLTLWFDHGAQAKGRNRTCGGAEQDSRADAVLWSRSRSILAHTALRTRSGITDGRRASCSGSRSWARCRLVARVVLCEECERSHPR